MSRCTFRITEMLVSLQRGSRRRSFATVTQPRSSRQETRVVPGPFFIAIPISQPPPFGIPNPWSRMPNGSSRWSAGSHSLFLAPRALAGVRPVNAPQPLHFPARRDTLRGSADNAPRNIQKTDSGVVSGATRRNGNCTSSIRPGYCQRCHREPASPAGP